MNRPFYDFSFLDLEGEYVYSFLSSGIKDVTKVVLFQHIENNDYNLALLDYDQDSQTANDEVVTNNQDMPKVLATVGQIVIDFLKIMPNARILITGNSEIRQKLYARIMRNNQEELLQHYVLLGVINGKEVLFEALKYQNYQSIIIQNK